MAENAIMVYMVEINNHLRQWCENMESICFMENDWTKPMIENPDETKQPYINDGTTLS